MSGNQMKDRIVEDLKKAKDAGQLTTEKVRDIVSEAVSAAGAETKGGIEHIRPVVGDAVAAAVHGLREAGADAKETVEGAVEGAIASARSRGHQEMEVAREELRKIEARLKEEEASLAQRTREALEGAKEAGAALPEEIKKRVESAVANVRVRSSELIGLTKETVKETVKHAIESGKDVKETVAQITSDATERALKEGRFTMDRVKEIADKVMSGAVEAAEEAGKEIKGVSIGAFEGAQKGIASAVKVGGDKVKAFVHEDIAQTKENIEAIEGLFIETTRKVASRSGEVAKDVLNQLADQTQKTSSVLRKKALHAAEASTERLKQGGRGAAKAIAEAAGKASHVVGEGSRKLGKRSLDVAKGAISGMWKGGKDALRKEKEEGH